jgi:hypothetical protein
VDRVLVSSFVVKFSLSHSINILRRSHVYPFHPYLSSPSFAVVKKVDGAVDTLTGEQLELDPDSLCIAVETSKDKKLNAKLMNSLRDDAARASKRRR